MQSTLDFKVRSRAASDIGREEEQRLSPVILSFRQNNPSVTGPVSEIQCQVRTKLPMQHCRMRTLASPPSFVVQSESVVNLNP
jgi:hypothetical protein